MLMEGNENRDSAPYTFNKDTYSIFSIKSYPIPFITGDHDCMKEYLNEQDEDNESGTKPKSDEEEEKKEFLVFDPEPIIEGENISPELFKVEEMMISEGNIKSNLIFFNNFVIHIDEDIKNKSRLSTMEFMHTLFLQGTKCDEDMDSPYVYSNTKFSPFSYCHGQHRQGFDKKGKLLYPSPSFLSSEMWMTKPDLTKAGVFRGMQLRDDIGVVLVDKVLTKKFQGLIRDFIGQLLKAALGHRITLKVKLFEPKSFLQRTTDDWLFAPKFLPEAAQKSLTPLERMKLVMAFQVSGLFIPTKQLKPFNPLISETFQGEFESGTKVYLEQISNNPNASRFYILDNDFKIYGALDMSMVTESLGSKITVFTKGVTTVDFFKIDEKIQYILPTARLINATSENNRGLIWTNSMIFIDKKNSLKGVVKFGFDDKMIHRYEGGIFKCDYPPDYKFNEEKEMEMGTKMNFNDKKKKITFLSRITGSWLQEFVADGRKYWEMDKDMPHWVRPVRKCLPSDGRFREDLLWLYRSFYCSEDEEQRMKYEDLAQNWKSLLEQVQREEREMKTKARKKHKK